jgi:PhnB protein
MDRTVSAWVYSGGRGNQKTTEAKMKSNPYLTFNGQCEVAFKFYEELLGGKITFIQTWGDSPAAEYISADARHFIIHASLDLGDSILMGVDSQPGQYKEPKGMHVVLHFKETAEAERVFQALAVGGTIDMAFGKTFFAAGFGMCTDRFGIPWMTISEQAA